MLVGCLQICFWNFSHCHSCSSLQKVILFSAFNNNNNTINNHNSIQDDLDHLVTCIAIALLSEIIKAK